MHARTNAHHHNHTYPKLQLHLILLAILVQVLWSLAPSASNHVIDHVPVELFISIRWTLSGLIFLVIALLLQKPFDLNPIKLINYALLGVVGYAFSSFGTLYGLKWGGVVNFALLSSVCPLITASLSIFLLHEKVRPSFLMAAPLSVMGVLLMVVGKFEISGLSIALGSGLVILFAYVCEALPFIFSKRNRGKTSLISYMAVLQLSAAAGMWISQAFYFKQSVSWTSVPMSVLGSILFIAVVSCVICYGLLYWLLNRMEGHRLALFDGVHTLCAALWGLLFFGERVSFTMWLGGVLLISALYLAHVRSFPNLSRPFRHLWSSS